MADQALVWIDAGGASNALRKGTDTATQPGASGRFSPPPLFIAERVPLQSGQRFRGILHGPLTVQVPIALYGPSATAFRASLRTWAHRLDPVRGDGRLRVTGPAGDQRELVCRCSSGLDQVAEDDHSDLGNNVSAVLQFQSEQPYWADAADTVQSWTLLASLATFFPFFPLRLSGSEVFADATVDNSASDVAAWPVWTITGPGSNPILRNLTTGMVLNLPVTLLAGESVVIDTRPGAKTVTKQDGSSLFGSLVSPPQLWPLAQGSNSIRIEMTGATAGVSSVQLNYRRLYLSA